MNKSKSREELVAQAQKNSMKFQVEELELKARYWEATYNVRYYTIEADKLQVPYDAYIEKEREKQRLAMEDLQKKIEESKGQLKIDEIVNPENQQLPKLEEAGISATQ